MVALVESAEDLSILDIDTPQSLIHRVTDLGLSVLRLKAKKRVTQIHCRYQVHHTMGEWHHTSLSPPPPTSFTVSLT